MPVKEKEAEQMAITPDGKVTTPSTDPVEIARLQIEKMLEDAKKSAADIITEAIKSAEVAKAQVMAAPIEQPVENKSAEMITIRLFKDSDRYKDDLAVSVNGITYTIQRGKNVSVPRFVADVIDNSDRQDREAATYREVQIAEYQNNPQK